MFMFVKSDRSNETLIPTTNNDHVTVGGGRGGRRVSFGSGCGGCGIGGVVVAVVVEEFVITVVVAVALVAVVAVVAWRGHPYGSRRLVLALALVRGSLGGSGCVASIHTSSKSHRTAMLTPVIRIFHLLAKSPRLSKQQPQTQKKREDLECSKDLIFTAADVQEASRPGSLRRFR